MRISLSGGKEIVDAELLVRKFYKEDAHELYDRLEVPQDNKLDLICLASLTFFEVQNPKLASWRELWSKKKDIEDKLQHIPASLSIFDESIPWEALSELLDVFLSVKGFRCPRVSKILHKKRPSLIPILDEERIIKTYYQPVVEEVIARIHTESTSRGKGIPLSGLRQVALKLPYVMIELIRAVRNDILLNRKALEDFQREVSSEGLPLTTLRIFDIILWEYASANR